MNIRPTGHNNIGHKTDWTKKYWSKNQWDTSKMEIKLIDHMPYLTLLLMDSNPIREIYIGHVASAI